MEYYFQGAWMGMMNMFYTWSNNLMTEILTLSWDFMTSQWENDTKEIYTYDANDLNTEELSMDWQSRGWEFVSKASYSYGTVGIDDGHVKINSGIYFCRIQVDQAIRTYKVVVR